MEGNPDVDYSIYTRELARLIRYANIDFNELPDGEFDSPLGESTGASVIFGTTGGVIEPLAVQLMNYIRRKIWIKWTSRSYAGWKVFVALRSILMGLR